MPLIARVEGHYQEVISFNTTGDALFVHFTADGADQYVQNSS